MGVVAASRGVAYHTPETVFRKPPRRPPSALSHRNRPTLRIKPRPGPPRARYGRISRSPTSLPSFSSPSRQGKSTAPCRFFGSDGVLESSWSPRGRHLRTDHPRPRLFGALRSPFPGNGPPRQAVPSPPRSHPVAPAGLPASSDSMCLTRITVRPSTPSGPSGAPTPRPSPSTAPSSSPRNLQDEGLLQPPLPPPP